MRIPLSWLGELVEIPATDTADWLHATLVRVGFEEEAVHGGELRGPIVVGRVLEIVEEPQKNGKTIRWCQVDVGEANGGVRGIVCGALNFVEGDRVVVTLPGAALPGGFEIAARKTYGHVSDGMIASERELGLGDDHDGIMRLDVLGIPGEIGDDALAILGLDDQAVEINVTPDRGYALSLRGIAREVASATGQAFRDPASIHASAIEPGTASGFPVELRDAAPIRGRAGCSRFVARVVRGIDPSRPTPAWLASRLRLAGIRSISLPVDITNAVMLELGQPIHGYDLGKLRGGIVVRRAAEGERLTTLDGADRALSTEDLLITDDRGAIGLAGVMGGAETEMDASTTDVLIEAATFDAVTIGRTARRHKLFSEASKRYERGVDPAVAAAAAARVAQLLVELAGGTIDELGADVGDVPAMAPITIPVGYWSTYTGADYTVDEARDALERIGASIDEAADAWTVTPPTWRRDLVDREGLVEEVARIVGFDRIPSVLPVAPPGRGYTRPQRLRRRVADALASTGLTEVLVAPFVSEQQARLIGAEPVRLENPLDGERPWLRTALLPGMLDTAHRNLGRGLTDLALFELGRVFHAVDGQGTESLPASTSRPEDDALAELDRLPAQPDHAAVLLVGGLAGGALWMQGQVGRAASVTEASVARAVESPHAVPSKPAPPAEPPTSSTASPAPTVDPEAPPLPVASADPAHLQALEDAVEAGKLYHYREVLIDPERSPRGDHPSAEAYCAERDAYGFSDWRLPQLAELSSVLGQRLVGNNMYWSATPGDLEGELVLAYDGYNRRVRSLEPGFKGAHAICVRAKPPTLGQSDQAQ